MLHAAVDQHVHHAPCIAILRTIHPAIHASLAHRVNVVKDLLQFIRGGHAVSEVRPELVPRDDTVVILIDAPEQVVDNLEVYLGFRVGWAVCVCVCVCVLRIAWEGPCMLCTKRQSHAAWPTDRNSRKNNKVS
jgi:hypothetical protein